jgi:exosortase
MRMNWRSAAFLSCCLLIVLTISGVQFLLHVQIAGEYSSQTLFIPLLSAYLLWDERKQIFIAPRSEPMKMTPVLAGAVTAGLLATWSHITGRAYWFEVFALLSAILLAISSFVAVYGGSVLRRATFPLSLLLLAIPFPESFVQGIISVLQAQSASLSAILFSSLGIPVYKQGILLTIPGVTIEVARECSGINSSIALVVTMLLVARQSLRSTWRRVVLVAATIPLSIIKNAIRITTLTVLAVRVNPSFLTGRLHHQGGFVFYFVAMGLLYPIWALLRNSERRNDRGCYSSTRNTHLDPSRRHAHTQA